MTAAEQGRIGAAPRADGYIDAYRSDAAQTVSTLSLSPPLSPNFHSETMEQPGAAVITVAGELDIASAPQLEATLAGLSDRQLVVIDLRKLEFVDSTGLGVLVRAHQQAAEHGRSIGLVRGAGQVEKLLSLTGLESQLLIGESVEELLNGSVS